MMVKRLLRRAVSLKSAFSICWKMRGAKRRKTISTREIQMFERKPATSAELQARKAFNPAEPKTTEYARAQKSFDENRERLKSERLPREAAATDSARKRKSNTEN